MPSNASGVYSLPASYFAVNGSTVEVAQHNTPLEDIRDALTDRLMRDGRAPMTGALQMGGHKITGLGGPTAGADAATKDYADAREAAAKAYADAREAAAEAYADSIVGGVMTFHTRNSVSVRTVPASVTAIRTAGRTAPFDGGGCTYVRRSSMPSTPGAFQDASGAWFELAPETYVTPEMFDYVGVADPTATDPATLAQNIANTTAVNAALNWPGKDTLLLQKYYVNAVTQTVGDKTVRGLNGDNCGLFHVQATNTILTVGTGAEINYVRWQDFTVDAVVTKTDGWGIDFNNIARCEIAGVKVGSKGTPAALRKIAAGVRIDGAVGNVQVRSLGINGRYDTAGTLNFTGLQVESEVNNLSEVTFDGLSIEGFTAGLYLGGGCSVKLNSGDISSSYNSITSGRSPINDLPNRELFVGKNFTLDRAYNCNFVPGKNSIAKMEWDGSWCNAAKVHNVLMNVDQSGLFVFNNTRFEGTALGSSVVVNVGSNGVVIFRSPVLREAGSTSLAADYGVTASTAVDGMEIASGVVIVEGGYASDNARYGVSVTASPFTGSYQVRHMKARLNGTGNYNNTDAANESGSAAGPKVFVVNGQNAAL